MNELICCRLNIMKSDQSVLTNLLAALLVTVFSSTRAEFRVYTSETPVTAIYGQYTVLRCSFTVQAKSSLDGLVINWERVETEEVVFSYYYGKEQRSHQSSRYSGRTSLFLEELKHGNASMKLEGVRAEDAGQYKCFVSNVKGSDQDTLSLIFAELEASRAHTRIHWLVAVSLLVIEFLIILMLVTVVCKKHPRKITGEFQNGLCNS